MIDTPDTAKTADGVVYPVSAASPFKDKFDLTRAIAMVGDLYQAEDPPGTDPNYWLLMMIWDHEDELKQMRSVSAQRNHAESVVPFEIASKKPGRLIRETALTLHTNSAQYMFIGREHVEGDVHGIPGLYRFAQTCFLLMNMGGADNPYADQALIKVTDALTSMQRDLNNRTQGLEALIEAQTARGLRHKIVESERPLVINDIRFGSAYGYFAVDLLATFDYWIRVLLTMHDVGQVTTDQYRRNLRDVQTAMRALAELPIQIHSKLKRNTLLGLCRNDFGPNADEAGRVRAALAKNLLGKLDPDVLSEVKRPSHYLRESQIKAKARRKA